jgi:hypothetical protein
VLQKLRHAASGGDSDGSSSSNVGASAEDADLCTLLEALLRKPMKPAVYMCAGEVLQSQWRKLYTYFSVACGVGLLHYIFLPFLCSW